jgi:hypothetical protein
MPTTWTDEARAHIALAVRELPDDADLKTRRAAIRKARPHHFSATSWGRKCWARAAREYLVRFGYVPRSASAMPLLSPLDRAKAKAEARAR